MKRLVDGAFICILFVLIVVMLTADFFHKLDDNRSWWEEVYD